MLARPFLFFEHGIAIYLGDAIQTSPHSHHAIQLIFSLEGLYRFTINSIHIDAQMLLINPDIVHQHQTKQGRQLSIFIDPECEIGKRIAIVYPAPYHHLAIMHEDIIRFAEDLSNTEMKFDYVEERLVKWLTILPQKHRFDSRIDQLISNIYASQPDNLQVKQLLANIPLSESRVRHLFKEQIGLSIQRFIVWMKIQHAFNLLVKGESFSQAAYLSGFSDYAHLSRTIKEMFGINLSGLIKNSHSIQDL